MTDRIIEKWTVVEEENVSPSRWFPLLRQKVKLPNGLVLDDYFFAPLGDVVQVLAITPNKEVVMVRQYKHGIGEILLELPGGMRQDGKSIIQSALNELEEETGIKVDGGQLISLGKIAINPTKLKQITYGYIVFNVEFNSVQKPDVSEDIQIELVPAPKVLQKVKDGEIWATDSMNFILLAALRYPEVFNPDNL